jgi:hypothetical protein
MSHGGKIYDKYYPNNSKKYIEAQLIDSRDDVIFLECKSNTNFEEKLKFAQNFENKFLKTKYLEDLIKTFPKNP